MRRIKTGGAPAGDFVDHEIARAVERGRGGQPCRPKLPPIWYLETVNH